MAPAVTPPAPVPTPVPAVVVVAPVVPVGGGGGGCQVGGEDVGDAHGVPPQRFDVLVSVSSPPVWLLPVCGVWGGSPAVGVVDAVDHIGPAEHVTGDAAADEEYDQRQVERPRDTRGPVHDPAHPFMLGWWG